MWGANLDAISTGAISIRAFVSMLVPVAVFFACQRSFVRGILAGSVK